MTSIAEIASFLEDWAPPATAESYDNVGLLIGDKSGGVRSALIALDVTPGVVAEAVEAGVDLIVSHHPLIFTPLSKLVSGQLVSGMALRLARAGIALYSAHTNLDSARGGVSFELANRLGLEHVGFFQPAQETTYKLVTFVPVEHLDEVRRALGAAGAGRIGDYSDCSFAISGTGHFRPGPDSNPAVGEAGGPQESVPEIRLEVEVDRWSAARAIEALKSSHPYEEVAYDLYPVNQPSTNVGLGAIGSLSEPLETNEFLTRIAEALSAKVLRWSGTAEGQVSRVAVCGGSGSHLIHAAMSSGCQALVTSDVSYHRFFEVFDDTGEPGLLLVDAGHYETEAATEGLLARVLTGRFPEVTWATTRLPTNPINYFTGNAD